MSRSILLSLLIVGLGGFPLRADEDADGLAASAVIEEIEIDDFDRGHWAYLPLQDPPLPEVSEPSWARTAIDRFVLSRLEQAELSPSARADRHTLLRRLHFDLTGLPPTPCQLDAFVNDQRPDAYRRLVESLLASPAFGQRWAQYWLDLARFAETDGYEHDNLRPTAWRYRDWVIEAFNSDMPYDQFVSWQIAGDALAPDGQQEQGQIATAFCLSGPDMPDINSQQERKHVLMNEVTSTVGAVLLSLQFGCAQCHDHKYDAISQADFYRLRAFFDPAVVLEKNKSITTFGLATDPAASSRLMIRGDWRRPGPKVPAAFPRIVNPEDRAVSETDPAERRAQLARWLASPENPLTPRSIVNRIWQHHFGRGLSNTPSDFGVMGAEPTHPELLDYLATRLIEGDWSLKRLHREIVLSSVYQQRSQPPEDQSAAHTDAQQRWNQALQIDPDNHLLARFPRRRLNAESLRDAMLAVSGSLNREAGGPGVRPPLPPEMIKTLKSGQWDTTDEVAEHYRKSIYIFARRNLRYPFFATFDRPAANLSCAARQRSTTAVQSLLLFNSKTTIRSAESLAANLRRDHGAAASQCRELYRRLLARNPSDREVELCLSFLQQQQALVRSEGGVDPEHSALVDLCRALLNSNEFLYID